MRLNRLKWFLLSVFCGLTIAFSPVAIAQVRSPALPFIQQAQQQFDNGRYPEAAALLQAAAQQFATQGDVLNQAMALSNLAATYAQLGDWAAAEQTVNTSLTLLKTQAQTPDQQRIFAQTLDTQGQLQLERGRAQAALASWTEAADRARSLQASALLLQAQIHQSQALQALGLYPRACTTLLAALQLAAPTCELTPASLQTLPSQPIALPTVQGLNALGHVLRVLGKLDESQQVLALAAQQAQQLDNPAERAAIALHQGNTFRVLASQPALTDDQRQQSVRSARDAYQFAAQRTTKIGTRVQAQLNQLSLAIEQGDSATAIAQWQAIPPELDQLPANRSSLFARINLAQSLINLTQVAANSKAQSPFVPTVSDIASLLDRAIQQAGQLGDRRLQAAALGKRGKLYALQQQWTQAETITQQAIGLVPPFEAAEIAYPLRWQMGQIQRAQGKTAAAIDHYSQAVSLLATLRGDLVALNPDVQFSFRESVEPIYRQLVGLLLNDETPSQANLKQARQVIESLQLAELDNFFRDACADAKPRLIDEVDRTAAVVYPIILPDRLEVILALPDRSLHHHRIRQPQAELEQTFQRTRTALRRAAFPREYLPLAQQLYDWLIRPAAAALANSNPRTLVFVLDGTLRNLPMAVLHDGQQFLIEKYSLALTPGLQLLAPEPLQNRALRAFVAGLSDASQGFAPLPAVQQEVEQVSGKVASQVLLNQQFTRANVQSQINASPFTIVHLATHGQFSSAAEQTFLLTWDGRLTVNQLDRLLRARPAPQPIELLILSACQTAAGDRRAALGMAGVAIRSGARSTLATLWLVNDEATANLITEFYRQFTQPGINRAEALRQAQLKLLADPQSQHPYYWSAFVLVGNWL